MENDATKLVEDVEKIVQDVKKEDVATDNDK